MHRHVSSKAVGSIGAAADVHVIVRGSPLGEAQDGPQVIPHDEMMVTMGPSTTRERLNDKGRGVALEKGDVTMPFPSFCCDHLPPSADQQG
eukprot:5483776-Pyramimonas_sp.AAC.1